MIFNARMGTPVFSVIFLLALNLGGCNDCDFAPHCEGNVVVQCGEIDQQVGREESRAPCPGDNPVCVEAGWGTFCAASSKPSCTPETVPGKAPRSRCDGQIELRCESGSTPEGGPGGYEIAMDCRMVHEPGKPPGNYECKTTPTGGTCRRSDEP